MHVAPNMHMMMMTRVVAHVNTHIIYRHTHMLSLRTSHMCLDVSAECEITPSGRADQPDERLQCICIV